MPRHNKDKSVKFVQLNPLPGRKHQVLVKVNGQPAEAFACPDKRVLGSVLKSARRAYNGQ